MVALPQTYFFAFFLATGFLAAGFFLTTLVGFVAMMCVWFLWLVWLMF